MAVFGILIKTPNKVFANIQSFRKFGLASNCSSCRLVLDETVNFVGLLVMVMRYQNGSIHVDRHMAYLGVRADKQHQMP